MAIQIKGVNPDLLLYKTELERKPLFSDKMIARFHRVVDKAQCLPVSNSPIVKAKEAIYGAGIFGYGMAALASYSIEMGKKKQAIAKATGIDASQIAIDINELEQIRKKRMPVKVFGDDIRYSAQIRKEWLNGIEIIFGDANFQALDDFECLSSLRAIYGDLNFAQCKDSKVDISPLQLEMVYGDIHAERAVSTEGLGSLLAVGGNIYYQDGKYRLDDFQQAFDEDSKERQK